MKQERNRVGLHERTVRPARLRRRVRLVKMRILRRVILLFVVTPLATGRGWGGDSRPDPSPGSTGKICVAKLPKNAAEIDRDPVRRKTRREYTYQFSVKFNARDWVKVSSEHGVLIQDLPTDEPHTVTIRDGDRVIESFSFTFEEKGSSQLCLSYTPWYQTWRLDAPRPKAWWCRCEGAGQ